MTCKEHLSIVVSQTKQEDSLYQLKWMVGFVFAAIMTSNIVSLYGCPMWMDALFYTALPIAIVLIGFIVLTRYRRMRK